MTTSPMQPLVMSDPHRDIIPHAYIIYRRLQDCECCGAQHSWTDIYAETRLRANMGLGKQVVNWRRLDGPPAYNLPILRREAPRTIVPFCHNCFDEKSKGCGDPSLAHAGLKDPPRPDPAKIIGIGATRDAPQAKAAKTRKDSVDKLMELLS